MKPSTPEPVPGLKEKTAAIVRELHGQTTQADAQFDLGKKVSVPQDLMLEELSLKRNRGSHMYLERQKRVQKYTFEYPSNMVHAGSHMGSLQSGLSIAGGETSAMGMVDGKENNGTEIHNLQGDGRTPPNVPKKSAKVLQMKMCLNPGALAPGYSGPLKGIPFEKFNSTAIPKSYRSPWAEDQKVEIITSINEALPDPPQTPLNIEYHSYNRTPIPFGSLSVLENMNAPTIFEELQAQIEEATSGLQLMCQRPTFNRAPRGWAMKFLPETVDL
ncbi:hypothetical protein GDO86_005209 [Hymenochirus boettgeri]|uniref:Myozenin 3 n=1 Tax=Hymenochirus boettgeri TaxID=247094 RepID=A0A8T2J916_9PIPI|nr:hypothetical protein GDO86_005209 [Hymenochirus boettgeri]